MPSTTASADKDDAMRLSVERQLQGSGHSGLRQVRCFVKDGVVVLFGTVPSYHMKQVAQTIIMNLALELQVENRCEVAHSPHGNNLISRCPKGAE
jgi:osmotically-inducible protein OsmY